MLNVCNGRQFASLFKFSGSNRGKVSLRKEKYCEKIVEKHHNKQILGTEKYSESRV